MSEHDRDDEETRETRKVRVTDKRRVHMGDEQVPGGQPLGAQGGGSSTDPEVGEAEDADSKAGRADVELEEAKKQAAEYLEHLQRLQAEFANYRKRVLKEQTRAVEMASEPLVGKLLEVLDEFELALMAAADRPDFDRFLHGVELVFAKLKDTLAEEGLERIDAQGRPFDPELHDALMQSGETEGEAHVADVLRPGYTLKGRVIRPAGVKVVRR